MAITIKQLEIFIAIVQSNNVTRASKSLKLSQSAVSMALSELEKQLGEILFDRSGKRLILNSSGQLLLPKAIEITSRVKEVNTVFTQSKNELSGTLKVGASATIGNYQIPKIISDYAKEHKKVKVALNIKNTEDVINDILNFNCDLGIVEGLCHRKELETLAWKKDTMAIVTSSSHELSKKKKVTIEDLGQQEWVLREVGTGPRMFFESLVPGRLDQFNIRLELGDTEAIKKMIQSGFGVACLSTCTIQNELEQQKIAIIKTPYLNLERYFYIILHKEKYKTILLNSFLKHCKKGVGITP